MSVIKSIINNIERDVANENEAKRRSVIMRIFILVLAIYFLLLAILMRLAGVQIVPLCSLILFAISGFLFHGTYINRTKEIVFIIQSITYLWIVLFVYLFGWNCGTQHFLFVLLIFTFLCGNYRLHTNLFIALLLCITRLALYSYSRHYSPIYNLGPISSVLFQYLNTITIFCEITFLIYSFSKESISIEKKLTSYNQKIQELASMDPLTNLRNRRSMMEYLNKKIDATDSIPSFCIAIADIDFFKKVNDTYGHDAGDEVLRRVSAILKNYMKQKGTVCRWGGEEFLFYLKQENGDTALAELDELRRLIQNTEIVYNDQKIPITMTFGLQEYTSYKPLDFTITHADQKLYQGKESGRNCVIF